MFDIRWIRENPEAFDQGLAKRGLSALSAEIIALDAQWKAEHAVRVGIHEEASKEIEREEEARVEKKIVIHNAFAEIGV